MYLNTIRTPKGKILAVCDKELINKTLNEGEITLDIKKHSNFYKGKLVNEKELLDELKNADSFNLIGKRCIEIAHKSGLIDKTTVKLIGGVPHIQIYII
ncbi:DUF424 family protein [Candidatus Micrarchaeota archaeon]|nr:DUF424 family protein [Candidatus Micrarchaeota archaeon]